MYTHFLMQASQLYEALKEGFAVADISNILGADWTRQSQCCGCMRGVEVLPDGT